MSCFIVDNKTIDRIISFLIKCEYSSYTPYCYIKIIMFKDLGLNLSWQENKNPIADFLGQKMVNLNYKAVNYNYDLKDKPHKYKFNDEAVLYGANNSEDIYFIRVLKTLQCYLYQCNEGNFNKTKLFKALEKVENVLKDYIIYKLPHYKTAEWG